MNEQISDPGARSVLLVGLPRSGSTWIGSALGHAFGVTYVHEPDNDARHRHTLPAKGNLGLSPTLRADDRAPEYAQLFAAALRGPRPSRWGDRRRAIAEKIVERGPKGSVARLLATEDGPWPWHLELARRITVVPSPVEDPVGIRVVKSVHAGLAVDFLVEHAPAEAAAMLLRHPANVIGSMRDVGMQGRAVRWESPTLWDRHGPPSASPGPAVPPTFIERASWHFAMLANAMLEVADRRALVVVDHEDLLDDPPQRLASVAERLGLPWDEHAEAWVAAHDRPGGGYAIHRIAAEQHERWRDRLSRDETRVLGDILGRYPRLDGRWRLR